MSSPLTCVWHPESHDHGAARPLYLQMVFAKLRSPEALNQVDLSGQSQYVLKLMLTNAGLLNDLDIAKAILRQMKNVNTKAGDSTHILYYGLRSFSVEFLELLMQHGADVNNAPNKNQWVTPLYYAKEPLKLQVLLRYGADPYAKDPDGKPMIQKLKSWSDSPTIRIMIRQMEKAAILCCVCGIHMKQQRIGVGIGVLSKDMIRRLNDFLF